MIWVVAAALLDSEDRILLQQRPPGKEMANLWEFPGGKIDPGETPIAALIRELQEELSITVAPEALVPFGFATDDAKAIAILLYSCRAWAGEPRPLDAQALEWVEIEALPTKPMPPIDVDLTERLIRQRAFLP